MPSPLCKDLKRRDRTAKGFKAFGLQTLVFKATGTARFCKIILKYFDKILQAKDKPETTRNLSMWPKVVGP